MVKSYKKNRVFSKASVICFVAVISLGLVGLCYGVWNDNLLMNISLSTGFMQPEFELENGVTTINEEDGKLTLSLSDDNTTLYIDGWCYPTFETRIPVKIINKGSVAVKPYILSSDKVHKVSELDAVNSELTADISGLPEQIEGKSSDVVIINFQAKDLLKDQLLQVQEAGTDSPGFDFKCFIEKLQQEEEHVFTYELRFEQAN